MTREEYKSIIHDIEENDELSPDELELVKRTLKSYLSRCYERYAYYEYFAIATGKKYGDAIERKIIKSFRGFLKPQNDTSFDAITPDGKKVEIKSLRACTRGKEHIFLRNDDVSVSHFSTSSYQQTKPSCCDWFIFHILYGDGSRLFLIPSSMISKRPGEEFAEKGKIPLSVQHRNHETEGQVNLGQVIKYAPYFEIVGYKLEDDLYDFSRFESEITARLDKVAWELPE